MTVKVYSANEVSVSFAAIPIDSGRGDDEFVRIEQQEDTYTYKAGVDGEGTRSESRNFYTVVTLTVMQSSSANERLSAIHNLDIKVPGGSGVGPMLVRDCQGLTVFASSQAWIIKPPDQSFAREAGTREWKIGCHAPANFVGGNNALGG